MAKIKWKNQSDIDKEKQEQDKLQKQRDKFKKKSWTTLSGKEKDELLYLALKQLSLID